METWSVKIKDKIILCIISLDRWYGVRSLIQPLLLLVQVQQLNIIEICWWVVSITSSLINWTKLVQLQYFSTQMLPSTNRLGRHPFKVQIGVQTSLGVPLRWYGPAPYRSKETRN